MDWVLSLSETSYRGDVVIVAGDVSDELELFERAMAALARKFGRVFFTPGNHDLWVKRQRFKKRRQNNAKPPPPQQQQQKQKRLGAVASLEPAADSLDKLRQLTDICAALGVLTAPALLSGGLWVVPVLSWYHSSFDTEPDVPLPEDVAPPIERMMSDFHLCDWPDWLRGGDEREVAGDMPAVDKKRGEWTGAALALGLAPALAAEPGAADAPPGLGPALAKHMDELNDNAPVAAAAAAAAAMRAGGAKRESGESAGGAGGAGGAGDGGGVEVLRVAASWREVEADIAQHGRRGGGGGAGGAGRAAVARYVVSFSHFLPELALCPEKRYLYYPHLPKAVGSVFLGARVRSLQPHVHVFGHTHFGWDGCLPAAGAGAGTGAGAGGTGTRYVQCALGYPQERQRRMRSLALAARPGALQALSHPSLPSTPPAPPAAAAPASPAPSRSPVLLLSLAGGTGGTGGARGGSGGAVPRAHFVHHRYHALWSAHYDEHARDPANTALAPWVRKHISAALGPRAAVALRRCGMAAARSAAPQPARPQPARARVPAAAAPPVRAAAQRVAPAHAPQPAMVRVGDGSNGPTDCNGGQDDDNSEDELLMGAHGF